MICTDVSVPNAPIRHFAMASYLALRVRIAMPVSVGDGPTLHPTYEELSRDAVMKCACK